MGMTSICLQALDPLATKSIWGVIFNDSTPHSRGEALRAQIFSHLQHLRAECLTELNKRMIDHCQMTNCMLFTGQDCKAVLGVPVCPLLMVYDLGEYVHSKMIKHRY